MASTNCFLHPHHVTLTDHPHTFQSIRHHFQDPYYYQDERHSHSGLVAPKFDVYGNQTAYFLNGELPGVADKKQISVTWIANQTLVVRGWLKPVEIEADWDNGLATETMSRKVVANGNPVDHIPEKSGEDKAAKIQTSDPSNDNITSEPKTWLHERLHGEFERSFTFPTDVKHDGVRARLENGLLRMMVPKAPAAEHTEHILVE